MMSDDDLHYRERLAALLLEKRHMAEEADDEDRQAEAEAAARQGRATDEALRAALERLRATRHSAPDESRGRLNQ